MMFSLTASDILKAWESGRSQDPVQRALTLLALSTGRPSQDFVSLPIGRRDGLLLSLRRATLGPQLESTARCPSCSLRVEMAFNTSDVQFSSPDGLNLVDAHTRDGDTPIQADTRTIQVGEYSLEYRLPDSSDLTAIQSAGELEAARQALIQRCIVRLERDGEPLNPTDLPNEVADLLADHLAQEDPQADISLHLTCPDCGHSWHVSFDIGAFFWTEIETLARRLLDEVHLLARAYGWDEADILAMSAVRRQAYLEMVTA